MNGTGRILLAGLLLCVCGAGADPLRIDVGAEEPGAERGYGWGERERDGERSFSWIRALEADLFMDAAPTSAVTCTLWAVPFYQPHRKQRIGLFVNHRLLGEWTAPHVARWTFYPFRCRIPAEAWREGRNRITLRSAYKAGPGNREVSLAVDRLEFEADAGKEKP